MKCLSCGSESKSEKNYCGDCGARLGPTQSQIEQFVDEVLPEKVEDSVAKYLAKNQKVIENELSETVVNRLFSWAKLLAYFCGVPLALLIFLVGKDYFQVRAFLKDSEKQIEQTTAAAKKNLTESATKAVSDTNSASLEANKKVAEIRLQLTSLTGEGEQIRTKYDQMEITIAKYQKLDDKLKELEQTIQTPGMVVKVSDGTRKLVPSSLPILLTATDGNNQVVFRSRVKGPLVQVRGLEFHNNFADNYSVLVSAPGYRDAGYYPVRVSPGTAPAVSLMLLPQNERFNFASISRLKQADPKLVAFLSTGLSETELENRYQSLVDSKQQILANLFNIVTTAKGVHFDHDELLDYLKELIWDNLAQDRIYAYADNSLLKKLDAALGSGGWYTESSIGLVLHPGATRIFQSYRAERTAIRIAINENDTRVIRNTTCFKVELSVFCDGVRPLGTLMEALQMPVEVAALAQRIFTWQVGWKLSYPAWRALIRLT